jgi:hypothetical protein
MKAMITTGRRQSVKIYRGQDSPSLADTDFMNDRGTAVGSDIGERALYTHLDVSHGDDWAAITSPRWPPRVRAMRYRRRHSMPHSANMHAHIDLNLARSQWLP